MRFLVGAVALSVICVLLGAPAAVLLGWRPLPHGERQIVSKPEKARTASAAPDVAIQ
jgi:hypothetical protein